MECERITQAVRISAEGELAMSEPTPFDKMLQALNEEYNQHNSPTTINAMNREEYFLFMLARERLERTDLDVNLRKAERESKELLQALEARKQVVHSYGRELTGLKWRVNLAVNLLEHLLNTTQTHAEKAGAIKLIAELLKDRVPLADVLNIYAPPNNDDAPF